MSHRPPPYEILDHTADVAMSVHGERLDELFVNALSGLYNVVGDLASLGEGEPVEITLKADSAVELFHDWLTEALHLLEARHVLLEDVRFSRIDASVLHADASGVRVDWERSDADHEVKAVTYHDLDVRQTDAGEWSAYVILDI